MKGSSHGKGGPESPPSGSLIVLNSEDCANSLQARFVLFFFSTLSR